MSGTLALYARTFLIGIAVAAPVGAMGVLCIQRTLARGWRFGMLTGLGIATADGIYAALAAFGLSALSTVLVTWQGPLRLVGGIAMIVLGARAALSPLIATPAEKADSTVTPTADAPAADAPPTDTLTTDALTGVRLYAGAVGLTLTNPMTIMAFGAIFAGAGLSAQPGVVTATVATLGVSSGSLAWWATLVTGVALARHAVGARVLTGINVASGAVVAVFGVVAVASVFIG